MDRNLNNTLGGLDPSSNLNLDVKKLVYNHHVCLLDCRIKIDLCYGQCLGLGSTRVKVYPDTAGALKKRATQSIGKSREGWTTKIHMVLVNDRPGLTFSISSRHYGSSTRNFNLSYTKTHKETARENVTIWHALRHLS